MYCIIGRSSSNFRDYLQRRLRETKQKQRTKAGPSTVKYGMKMKGADNIKWFSMPRIYANYVVY